MTRARQRLAWSSALIDQTSIRVCDVFVSVLVLALTLPVFAAVGAAIKLDSPGPIFYRSVRVGRRGRLFAMLKFRKVRHDAEGSPLTVADDVRLTRIGAFLVKTKLDELPQFWNVVKGDMSLVGPRPEDASFVSLEREVYDEILQVTPGITGLSQLAFAREGEILDPDDRLRHYVERLFPQKLALDRLYTDRRSLATNVGILSWTLVAVLLRRDVAVNRGTGRLNLRRRSAENPIHAQEPSVTPAPPARGCIEAWSSHAMIELLGRAAAVALPVFAVLAIEDSIASRRGLILALAVSGVFLASVQAGFAANATELLALGPLVAAARGTVLGLVLVSALHIWFGGPHFAVGTLFLCSGAVLTLVTLWQSILRRFTPGKRRVLIVGRSGGAPDVIEELWSLGSTPFEVIGVVDDEGESGWPAGVTVLGGLDDLSNVIEAARPDLVVVALDSNRPTIFGHLLERASTGFRVVEITQFFEHALGRVPVRELTRAWFMSVLHLYQQPYSRTTKRVFDLVGAWVGLLLTLPFLPVVALLVRLTTGPVILRQTRVGEHGELFTMYKFRTMRPDAERSGEAVWASKGDPRATRVGRGLRRIRLDEVPQLWNVIRGEMSIVGPRPERPEFFEELEQQIPFWTRRQLIKPGITGWAQIRRGYTADMTGSTDKLSYDFWYLRHRSLLVDFAICLHTVGVIISGGSQRSITRTQRQPDATLPAPSSNGAAHASPANTLAVVTPAYALAATSHAEGAEGCAEGIVQDVSANRVSA
jgi:exopolysaccharide biosynthesis polyprenyl glycosylphosphotransferase